MLEPVDIEGFNISAATLHNWRTIQDKGILIGDMVSVIRANDVIPHIVGSYKEERTGAEIEPILPTTCPICGGHVEFEGENLFCKNDECTSQEVARLQHFISKPCMNMKSFGDDTLFQFYQLGYVRSYKDIFHLSEHRSDILELDGFGKKKVNTILSSIESAKQTTLHQFLYSLSIKWLGKAASLQIEKNFKSIEAILDAYHSGTLSNLLLAIPDIGPALTTSFITYLSKNIDMVQELINEGLVFAPVEETSKIENSPITGKTFVITGELYKYRNRTALETYIKSLGGKMSGSVSKKTDYLITNDTSAGSTKTKKAIELSIKILSEMEFIDMCKTK